MRATKVFSAITSIWIIGGIALIFLKFESVKEMGLNELGDFTAGFFSPLAFMWLIAGYIQQGKELQLNTEALRLQVSELSQSVAQQKELVEVTKAEADLNRQAHEREIERETRSIQPSFSIETFTYSGRDKKIHEATFFLKNSGAHCTNIIISCNSGHLNKGEIPHMINGGSVDITFTPTDPLREFITNISYIDARNKLRNVSIRSQLTYEGSLIHFPASDPIGTNS